MQSSEHDHKIQNLLTVLWLVNWFHQQKRNKVKKMNNHHWPFQKDRTAGTVHKQKYLVIHYENMNAVYTYCSWFAFT